MRKWIKTYELFGFGSKKPKTWYKSIELVKDITQILVEMNLGLKK